ncbi:MAG: hypothetical protein ACR2FJ_08475 [Qipengyuania sp.]
MARHPTGGGEKAAFRRFVGRSVLAHQVDAALALDCDSVICLAAGMRQEIIACQHRAESGGARFQMIDSSRRLPGLVKADDELIVLADGLLPDFGVLADLLRDRPAILTFPDEPAVARGFERIDSTRAWAGAMRCRGASAEKLNDLSEDADAASSLLRFGLQSGIRTVSVDPAVLLDGRWTFNEPAEELAELEKQWIARHVKPVSFAAPGLAIAERMGLRMARDFAGGALERLPSYVAVGSGMLAGLAAWFGRPVIGLGLLIVMAVAAPIGAIFEKLGKAGRKQSARLSLVEALRWAGDALIVGLVAQASSPDSGWLRLFVPLILLGLLRLAEARAPLRWRALYADRILLLSGLLLAAILGQLQFFAALLSLLVLATLLLAPGDRELTTD